MNVSAVGFLFQNNAKSANSYTCVIHKINPLGGYNRNVITSPLNKSDLVHISAETAEQDIIKQLQDITSKKNRNKFIGATVKDGVKETEIHSILSDKLYAVRTKDEKGKNHFRILGKNKTKNVLSHNLCINA